jgi:hypothetical protein
MPRRSNVSASAFKRSLGQRRAGGTPVGKSVANQPEPDLLGREGLADNAEPLHTGQRP